MENLFTQYATSIFVILIVVEGMKKKFKLKGWKVDLMAFFVTVAIIGYEYISLNYQSEMWYPHFVIIAFTLTVYFGVIGVYNIKKLFSNKSIETPEQIVELFGNKIAANKNVSDEDTMKALEQVTNTTLDNLQEPFMDHTRIAKEM